MSSTIEKPTIWDVGHNDFAVVALACAMSANVGMGPRDWVNLFETTLNRSVTVEEVSRMAQAWDALGRTSWSTLYLDQECGYQKE